MPDKYEIRTHYTPAIICSVPFIALGFYFIRQSDMAFWNSVLAQAVGGVTMGAALYYLAAYSCRHTGKWLEDRMFQYGRSFPTTLFLLDQDDNCSPDRKKEILAKIKKDFTIDLKGSTTGSLAGRKRIHEAIGHIRQRFFKNNDMILQRNIQFGFAKNLAGGSLVAIAVSLLSLLLSKITDSQVAEQISLMMLTGYIILFLYGLTAMKSNAKRYAHTLFDEFLAS